MARIPLPLDSIQVASPCPVSWNNMIGDGRVRFCSQCDQRVYNLAEMTRKQAEALVKQAEGRLCVRYYRRPDGTVMTKDCPFGLAAWRRRVAVVVGSVAAAFLFLLTWGAVIVGARSRSEPTHQGGVVDPIQMIEDWLNPPVVMGDICPPTPPPPPGGPDGEKDEAPPPPVPPKS